MTLTFSSKVSILQLELADFEGNTTVAAYDENGTLLKSISVEGDAPITYTIAGVGDIAEVVISSDSGWLGSIGYTLKTFACPLPDTGQTKFYDNSQEIAAPLPGDPLFGQDAHYTRDRSYTKLDITDDELPDTATEWFMVRDNVTGLIWEAKQAKDNDEDYNNPHDADNLYTWYDSDSATNGGTAGTDGIDSDTEDFINILNLSKFGGHEDWRVPTVAELVRILHFEKSGPAIDTIYFGNTSNSGYWTSDTDSVNSSKAWRVNLNLADVHKDNYKSQEGYVRAVRGEKRANQFIDNGNGTITDSATGLMWQKESVGPITWEEALNYCETNANLPGDFSDWRLPDVYELHSLINYSETNPSIDPLFSDTTSPTGYWSSTTSQADARRAWLVWFNYGYIDDPYYKTSDYYVRAVRSEQSRSFTYADISVTPTSIDFGSVEVGTAKDVNLTIANEGNKDLNVTAITNSGSDADLFTADYNACNGQSIAPGEECSITITFSPDSGGIKESLLSITSSDTDTPELQVTLSGAGECVDLYYQDLDSDGFGAYNNSLQSCSQPTGYVSNNTDCNDNDDNEYPGQTWYKDADGDGCSDGTTITSCARPTDYFVASELTATTGDIYDNDITIYPGAPEICDGKDNDLDGETDESCESDTIFVCSDESCGENYPCYENIEDGYLASIDGVEIKVKKDFYLEELILSNSVTITLSGGWSDDFDNNNNSEDQSTIGGSLTITGGTVIVDGIVIGGTTSLARITKPPFGCWLPEYWSKWASLH